MSAANKRAVGPTASPKRRVITATSSAASLDGKFARMYDLEETLGKGHYAVVKLARHVFTGERVAVKVIDKTRLDDASKAQLYQEVR
jgi:SNF-related kinase